MYFSSIVLVIHSFANSKVHMVFLVSLFYRCAFIFLFDPSLVPYSSTYKGSRNVPGSSLITECFQLCSSSLYSSFNLFNLARFFGFTYLSKKQLSLPLLFLFHFSLVPSQILGRDPLVVVECCNAPRPTLQKTSSYSEFRRVFLFCLLFYFCIASCHHAIMSLTFASQLN